MTGIRPSGRRSGATSLTITNTGTTQAQTLVTNSSGYFEAVLLNPGTYIVKISISGFKTYASEVFRSRRVTSLLKVSSVSRAKKLGGER